MNNIYLLAILGIAGLVSMQYAHGQNFFDDWYKDGEAYGQSVEEFPKTTDACIITKLGNLVVIKFDCGGNNYSQIINNMLGQGFTIKGIDNGIVFMEKIK